MCFLFINPDLLEKREWEDLVGRVRRPVIGQTDTAFQTVLQAHLRKLDEIGWYPEITPCI